MFTILAERKGGCCGYKCRHCPYGHFNVKSENRCTKLPDKAVLLKAANPVKGTVGPNRVLFWSGGKDSFMALQALERENAPVTLLTSFEPNAGVVPEQDIPMSVIFDQAKHLERDLIAVPNTGEYVASLLKGLALLGEGKPTLVFGDLHLKEVRAWREHAFAEHGYACYFPLFDVPYPELEARLFAPNRPATFKFSAIKSTSPLAGTFAAGDEITKEVFQRLKQLPCDLFGESGEYHTVVEFKD